MADQPSPGPLLTIREASQATGLSIKALRGRVERGTLDAVSVSGRRRIPMRSLLAAGLLRTEAAPRRRRRNTGSSRERGTSSGYPGDTLGVVLERLDEVAAALTALERAVDGVRERASNVEADRERRRVLEARLDAALERIRELEAATRQRA
jgi:hypothetical protein